MLREALTIERLHAMEPDDAAAYFVTWGAEGLTTSEHALLEGWLSEDVAHAAALARANRAWDSFAGAKTDEIVTAMREHALVAPTRRRPVWLGAIVAVAAALLLVIGGALGFSAFRGTIIPQDRQGSAIEYASVSGQVKEVVLPDGSHMTLDADSLVRARFDLTARSLQLVRGRAFFDVKHDTLRPFAVTAASRRIVDIGTRFDVSVTDRALHVTLEQGQLSVESLTPGVAAIPLHAGQELVEAGSGATVRSISAVDAVTGWRRGLLSFEDTPLSAAIVEVNRYSRTQLVIRDPHVRQMTVSGQFRAGDAERFASTVAEIQPVRLVRQGDRIEITVAK